jgi:hypothetical protein
MSDANSTFKSTLGARTAKLADRSPPNSSANDLIANRGYGRAPGARPKRSANGWPRSQGGRH